MQIYVYMYMHTHTHTLTYTDTNTDTYRDTQIHTHRHTHTYINTYRHTHRYTHTKQMWFKNKKKIKMERRFGEELNLHMSLILRLQEKRLGEEWGDSNSHMKEMLHWKKIWESKIYSFIYQGTHLWTARIVSALREYMPLIGTRISVILVLAIVGSRKFS